MNLLFDTNILILLSRDFTGQLINKINPDNDKIFISIVSIGELRSIGFQNGWRVKKWKVINEVIDEAIIVEVDDNLVSPYYQIDSYSQQENPDFLQYPFSTPRNMGKNDLWIAATGALLRLKLVTTDADFNHLNKVFLEVLRWRKD